MGQNAGYFNKANQRYSFFIQFKKVASKIDKHVMLSYLLLFNKRLEFEFLNLFILLRFLLCMWKVIPYRKGMYSL